MESASGLNPFLALDVAPTGPYQAGGDSGAHSAGGNDGTMRKRKNKKKKRDADSDDEGDNDDTVEFITPSGEVFELRAAYSNNQGKYDVKLHMTNERTFFKYLFAALHIIAIGTFMVNFFAQQDKYRLYIVMLAWAAAFAFVFWGLYGFYHRRSMMQEGRVKSIDGLNPHGPAFVLATFVLVYMTIIVYALSTNQYPAKGAAKLGGHGPPLSALLPT